MELFLKKFLRKKVLSKKTNLLGKGLIEKTFLDLSKKRLNRKFGKYWLIFFDGTFS